MKQKRNALQLVFATILFVATVIFYHFNKAYFLSIKNQQLIGCFILAISFFMMIKNWKNVSLSFVHMCILYFNYSFIYGRYFTRGESALFAQFESDSLYGLMIYIALLFMIVLLFMDGITYDRSLKTQKNFFIQSQVSSALVCGLIFFLAVVILVDKLLGLGSKLYEYSIIFEILAIYFSKGEKKYLIWIGIISVFLMVYGFYTGIRVGSLPFALVFIFMVLHNKINMKIILIGTFFGIILMTMIGYYADSGVSGFNIKLAFNNLTDGCFSLDTSIFAFLASCTFVKIVDFYSLSGRLGLLWQFVKSQVLGASVPNSKLALVSLRYYKHYNGGVLPYFMYFYLGVFGVVIIGIVLGLYLNLLKKPIENFKDIYKLWSVFLIAMTPKWYLYEPTQLFRGIMLLSLMWFLFMKINLLLLGRRTNG